MENDIKLLKLPVSQGKDLQLTQSEERNEKKQSLQNEIEKISNKVESSTQQIDQVERNLKNINQYISYYQNIILKMSVTLHQLEIDQVNAGLSREYYIEKSRRYLEHLSEYNKESELDTNEPDEYSTANVANLENRVQLLKNKVAQNREIISKEIGHLFPK